MMCYTVQLITTQFRVLHSRSIEFFSESHYSCLHLTFLTNHSHVFIAWVVPVYSFLQHKLNWSNKKKLSDNYLFLLLKANPNRFIYHHLLPGRGKIYGDARSRAVQSKELVDAFEKTEMYVSLVSK